MERLFQPDNQPDKKPDKTGDTDTPSKSKKRTTRVPLRAHKEIAEQPDKKTEQKEVNLFAPKPSGAEGSVKDEKEELESTVEGHELVLPEVQQTEMVTEPVQPEFLGELKIEHQDESRSSSNAEAESKEQNLEDTTKSEEETLSGDSVEAGNSLEKEPEAIPSAEPGIEAPPKVAPPLLFNYPPEMLQTQAVPSDERPTIESTYQNSRTNQSLDFNNPGTMLNPNLPAAEKYTAPSEPVITEKEANRRAFRARKRGVSRGVAAGGFAGYLWGRRKGRISAENKAVKEINSKNETIKQLAAERDGEREVSEKRKNILKRTQDEVNRILKQDWEAKFLIRSSDTKDMEHLAPNIGIESSEPALETFKPEYETVANEKSKEKPGSNLKETKKATAETTNNPEDKPITEDTYIPREGRRVELSAWHRIEVDSKTNRVVEAPQIEYGEAFQREQKQEKLAKDAAKAQTAAQLGVAVMQGGIGTGNTQAAPEQPKQTVSLATVTKPLKSVAENSDYIVSQLVKQTTHPLTWGVALVVVVLLFAFGVLR